MSGWINSIKALNNDYAKKASAPQTAPRPQLTSVAPLAAVARPSRVAEPAPATPNKEDIVVVELTFEEFMQYVKRERG